MNSRMLMFAGVSVALSSAAATDALGQRMASAQTAARSYQRNFYNYDNQPRVSQSRIATQNSYSGGLRNSATPYRPFADVSVPASQQRYAGRYPSTTAVDPSWYNGIGYASQPNAWDQPAYGVPYYEPTYGYGGYPSYGNGVYSDY